MLDVRCLRVIDMLEAAERELGATITISLSWLCCPNQTARLLAWLVSLSHLVGAPVSEEDIHFYFGRACEERNGYASATELTLKNRFINEDPVEQFVKVSREVLGDPEPEEGPHPRIHQEE